MKTIRVQFEVTADKLGTIVGLIAGEVQNLATKDMADVLAERAKRQPAPPVAPAPSAPAVQSVLPFSRDRGKPTANNRTRLTIVLSRALDAKLVQAGDVLPYEFSRKRLKRLALLALPRPRQLPACAAMESWRGSARAKSASSRCRRPHARAQPCAGR